MRIQHLAAVAAVVLVAGCSGARCPAPGPYMDAQTRPLLVAPDGLETPNASGGTGVPRAADVVHPELRGNRYEAEDGRMFCLDSPPTLARRP